MAEPRAIEELEHRVMRAVQARDRDELERLVGADFTLTTGRPGAEVRGREEWLGVALSSYRIDSFVFEELVVTCYPGCAIARSRYRQRGAMGEQRRDTTYRMTDVWVRMPAGWQLQARHAQPVEGD